MEITLAPAICSPDNLHGPGAILIAGGYGAWLIIPFVVGAHLTPSIKTALTTVLGATPLLTKPWPSRSLGDPRL
jgi:hypothetical protein